MSEQPMSTDAEVASPAFNDRDRVEGEFDATSIRAAMINRPREALYAFWRDFRNLPLFMENVKPVELLESGDKPGLGGQVIDITLIYTTLKEDPLPDKEPTYLRVPNSLFFQRAMRLRTKNEVVGSLLD